MENSLRDETESDLVSPWLWRAAVVTLALVVMAGLVMALWLGTRPAVTGTSVPSRDLGVWTFGPGASGNAADRSITLQATRVGALAYAVSQQRWADFALEVRAAPLTGPDDMGYGLIVRDQGSDDFVSLLIGPDGYIAVGQMSGGARRWRVPWQQWPHIERGLAENLVRAECRADRCRFYVNDEFAFEVDGVPREGQIGFAVWNPEGDDVSAVFKEWQVWK
jgi:hypothetical protein